MIEIERDASLRAYELTDEGAEQSKIIIFSAFTGFPAQAVLQPDTIIAIKGIDCDGTVINRFIIKDTLLRKLAKSRGWLKE